MTRITLWKTLVVTLLCMVGGGKSDLADTEIIVSAAASLTNAMTEVGKVFEQEYPDVNIVFNFASSGSLLQQMAHGAPVDVFASANQKFMDDAADKGLILAETRRDFVRNTLVLAVPMDSAKVINGMADLRSDQILWIAIGNPQSVPAGRYAREALQRYHLWKILTDKFVYANSVRQVLDYLRRGEVDAGLLYATDAMIGGKAVKVVAKVEKHQAIIYPIAVAQSTRNFKAATRFVEFVVSVRGQGILSGFGFTPFTQ